MKVGINIVPLFPGKIGGGEQYIRNVVSFLNQKDNLEIHLFVNQYALSTFSETPRLKLHEINLSIPHGPQLAQYIDYLALDVWFCPLFHLIPEKCDIASIVTIFDIQQEYFPDYFDKTELKARRKHIAHTVHAADKIITISEFSKQTIVEKYGINPDKIVVTYLDADSCFSEEIIPEKLNRIKSKLPDEYIFYPANTWPHKNHLKLLQAFTILKRKYNSPLKIVFSGAQNKEKKSIEAFIRNNGLRDDIKYLGYLPQNEIPYVYAGANMMVFPSKFEGFGIPLVEAMKSGVPIICSNCTSMPEIAGDAALYFNADDPEDIAEKIDSLYRDKGLRDQLVSNGFRRRAGFSWEHCVEETEATIRNVYKPVPESGLFIEEECPLVSIVTPSYNQGNFIKETIESVLNQSYPNIEYIVIDGGSSDESVQILRSYGNRIIWCSEKDEGQADAVNKGIRMAKGKIIGWLNSDDTYLPNAVSTIVEYFRTHPKVDMVYGEGYYIDKKSQVYDRYPTSTFDYDMLASYCFICQPAGFFTKEAVKKVGMLNKDLHLCMDYDLWMRIGKEGKISYIPDYLASSRMYEDNKTLSRRSEVYREVCATVKRNYGYTPFSWCYGYAHHLCGGKHSIRFKFLLLLIFIQYNLLSFNYLKSCLRKGLKRYLLTKTTQIEVESKERYSDGWLSRVYETDCNLEEDVKMIILTGQHLLPMEKPITVKISIDEKMQSSFELTKKGTFAEKIILREPLNKGYHFIRLEMDQVLNPMKARISKDPRNLSFIMEGLTFHPEV